MSPIPPNKSENFVNLNGEENGTNEPEEITIRAEEAMANGWDPSFYGVDYNYRQLNQSEPVNADGAGEDDGEDSESDKDSELPELDPDLEFEILAETRLTQDLKNQDIPSTGHTLDKDVFARKVELECEEIQLDATKSQIISSLMTGFQLPESAKPEWAKSLPEEVWKKNLLAQLEAKKTDLFANQAK